MACNCKKNVNPKYMDGDDNLNGNPPSGVEKIGNWFMQAIFGVVAAALMAVILVPLFIYILLCLCIGKQINLRIPNYKKWTDKFNKGEKEANN